MISEGCTASLPPVRRRTTPTSSATIGMSRHSVVFVALLFFLAVLLQAIQVRRQNNNSSIIPLNSFLPTSDMATCYGYEVPACLQSDPYSKRPRGDKRQFRVFVVVFKDHNRTRELVEMLLQSDLTSFSFEIVVISNFGTFAFPADNPLFIVNAKNLAVVNNYLRPEFSFGHLAQDWNAAAIYGFVNLTDPVSDVVASFQGDTKCAPLWARNVYEEHMRNGTLFLQSGKGDAFHSWTAEGVRRIGIWDERFVDIGYQEADMFLRAVLLEPDRVRIDDRHHLRRYRPASFRVLSEDGPGDRGGKKQIHRHSRSFWDMKWGKRDPAAWPNETWMRIERVVPLIPTTYVYPFFEWRLDMPVKRLWYAYEKDPGI